MQATYKFFGQIMSWSLQMHQILSSGRVRACFACYDVSAVGRILCSWNCAYPYCLTFESDSLEQQNIFQSLFTAHHFWVIWNWKMLSCVAVITSNGSNFQRTPLGQNCAMVNVVRKSFDLSIEGRGQRKKCVLVAFCRGWHARRMNLQSNLQPLRSADVESYA